jgi:acetyltransferase-like isoleucine patch superfamily enzyme
VFSLLKKFYLQIKYLNRVKIGKNVVINKIPTLIITKGSKVIIDDNCIIRDLVELRATKKSILHLRKNVKLDRMVRIIATNNSNIEIGDNVRVGIGSVFNGGGAIYVGENTLISGYVYLQTSMHNHNAKGDIITSGYTYGNIHIEHGSWLGVHTVIFPKVSLGERTIVGSNAVVMKSFPSNSIIGGIPAEILK